MTKVFFTDKCPAFMREAITDMLVQKQTLAEITKVPPWRQKGVCIAGHALLNERPDNECPACGEPNAENGDCLHSPDCEYEPKAAPWVSPDVPWRNPPPFNPQVDINNRLTTLELKLQGIEAWADIAWPCSLGSEAYEATNSIHELIADGMTGVTADAYSRIDAVSERLAIWEQWAAKQEKRIDDTLDYVAERTEGATTQCNESAAALVTVAVAAMDKRADAICNRADKMVEVMQMMTARIEALEQQNALLNRQAH
jgi:hypothetical protein